MKKIVRLTERDLTKLVKRVISEQNKDSNWMPNPLQKVIDKKQDSMYNPGSVIKLITNRQFIISRAYQYSDLNRNKQELELDIENATVVSRDSNGFIIKVPRLQYYVKNERMVGEKIPETKYLANVCLKIKFSDIIEWVDNTLQIQWFSDFVPGRTTDCNSVTKTSEKSYSEDCLKDFKISTGTRFGAGREYKYKEGKNNDGIIISFDMNNNKWNNSYRKILTGGKEEVGKWKCENGKFVTYDKNVRYITYQ